MLFDIVVYSEKLGSGLGLGPGLGLRLWSGLGLCGHALGTRLVSHLHLHPMKLG